MMSGMLPLFMTACVIAAFTVFVLLDTFAIARVQQSVQEADLSSIVTAQGETADDVSTGASNEAQDDGSGDGATGDSNGNGDDTVEVVTSDGQDEDAAASASSSHASGKRHGGHGASSGNRTSSSDSDASGESILEVGAGSASTAGTTIGSYSDENMQITVSQLRAYDTDIYVADIQVSSAEYLKTAFAQNAYGRNLKDTTSNMADEAGAVLAINGDYYGFRDDGYVVRNGVQYRDTATAGTDALVVYGDGSMASVSQDEATAQQLVDSGAWQVLSFGPTLVEDGQLAVSAGDEVDQAMGSNPRTAIGMISPLHYLVVVSDGRTGDNAGLSLYQLAQAMVDNGATYAYNLDGGGSSAIYFQGEVLNNPGSGNRSGEREVSDIVYFG